MMILAGAFALSIGTTARQASQTERTRSCKGPIPNIDGGLQPTGRNRPYGGEQ